MSNHEEAGNESKDLCDKLFQCLSERISNLKRIEKIRWCGFYQIGRNRFAYINHRKRMSRIEVWCLGDPPELQRNTSLKVEPRQPTTGGFGKLFQSRIFINDISEIKSLCELLKKISYRLS